MTVLRLLDISSASSYLLCNACMLCVFLCHRPFKNAATHFLPRLGIATDRHQNWVAYCRRFQALANTKLKQAKEAFKASGSHRSRKSKIPGGGGTLHATPVLQ